MKYIKPYEAHNESWRKAKAYLTVPALAVDMLLGKLLNYVPRLNFLYKSMAAKIDTGTSFNSGAGTPLTGSFEEIKLDDIKDEKIKRSLKLSGLFSEWYIYRNGRLSHDGKTPIYISKDVIQEGDRVHGQRLRTDDSTEFYVIAAKHSQEHDKMSIERKSSYEKKEYAKFKKLTKKAIEKGYFFGRTSMGDFTPLFHTLVRKNYLDLVGECLESAKRNGKLRIVVTRRFSPDGDHSDYSGSKNALELQHITEEMRELLLNALREEWLKKYK